MRKKIKPIQVETAQLSEDKKPQEFYTYVKHCANLGDIITALVACKRYYEVTRRKIIFCQQIDFAAHYYVGATHPTKSEDGTMVCVNKPMFDMVAPLVKSQEYIQDFVPYAGQKIDLNFDVIRGQTDVGMPNGMIQGWLMYAFPDLDYDLSKTWIDLPEVENNPVKELVDGKIIVNFTERYRNSIIEYYFLQAYAPDLLFAGTEVEHYKFCTKWNVNIPRLIVNDFLEYAYAIKYARFLLGNQSFGWNIATAIGTPRILEVCRYASNCQPFIGENSKGFFYQVGVEYYWRKFFKQYK